MSVRDNIAAGVYDDLPYPQKPSKVDTLRKAAGDLTAEERKTLEVLVTRHLDAVALYEAQMSNYRADRAFKHKRFESDLATENDVVHHKHRKKIFDRAWERGHSDGFLHVVDEYEDLAELLK